MESMFDAYSEWKLKRLGKFTASVIGKLLTASKTKGELFGDGAITLINGVISEILTGEPASDTDYGEIKSLEWGKAHEMEAVLSLETFLGVPVDYYGALNPKFIEYNKVSGGSPDGMIPSLEAVLEMKCPINKAKHVAALRARIEYGLEPANKWLAKHSKDYYAQVQFNMMCAKVEKGYFGSYDPRPLKENNKLAVLFIEKDATVQADIAYRIDEAKKIVLATLNALDVPPVKLTIHDTSVNAVIHQVI